jgi:hypothetical protein
VVENLKKVSIAVLLFILLFLCFIVFRFGSALTQEGNPIPYLVAILRYISEFEGKYPLGMAIESMETKGWKFTEQLGSGLIFEKGKKTITIETRQYSEHYFIWDIPKEIVKQGT